MDVNAAQFKHMSTKHLQLFSQAVKLQQANEFDKAEATYRKLLRFYPSNTALLHALGMIHVERGEPGEGLRLMNQAVALRPDGAEPHYERGTALMKLGRYNDALADFNRAIALCPDYASALFSKGVIKLLQGEYEEGWALFEQRWDSATYKDKTKPTFNRPLWLGKEAIARKTILLYAEQGLGDTIQLCRYAPLVQALGASVVLAVDSSLGGLISTLKGSPQVITAYPVPEFDFHCPLFSLPLALGTRVDTIPTDTPYLFADQHKQKIWRDRLGPKSTSRIGVSWSGNPKHNDDRNRSVPTTLLAELFRTSHEFHCVQKDIRPADAQALAPSRIRFHGEHLTDFTDTAALISEMDLIISVDTSVAHLAGALGKPVWIFLPFVPDHRWMLKREDSPWYPTARLFRQERIGDWKSVISKLIVKLGEIL